MKLRQRGKGNAHGLLSALTSLILQLTTALIAVGCHGGDDDAPPTLLNVLDRFNGEGKAWMTLNINLPVRNTTRSVTFVDGDEIDVSNIMIVLFHGTAATAEANLEVCSTYDATVGTPHNSSESQVTETVTATIQMTDDNINDGDKIYALAILNATPTVTAGSTFSAVSRQTLTGISTTVGANTYYMMSNAPQADQAGGSSNPTSASITTLVEIDPNYMFATEAEATSNPSASINVERAAAKVTVALAPGVGSISDNTSLTFNATDMSYALDNYNTSFYLTRQFGTDWLPYNAQSKGYRMVEASPVTSGGNRYRTYWARDVNYDNGVTTGLTHGTPASWTPMGSNAYCAENTFDTGHMTIRNTTAVLVRLRLNGGTPFYTTSLTGSDVIYSAATLQAHLLAWLMQFTDVQEWLLTYADKDNSKIAISITPNAAAGTATATVAQTVTSDTGAEAYTKFTALGLSSRIAAHITMSYYDGGYCYYRTPVKHFGDELTPWTPDGNMRETVGTVYGSDGSPRETAYLGRYGMVRNNWYDIQVESVLHVGAPTIPPIDDTPNDVREIILRMVIVPWVHGGNYELILHES